MSNEVVLGILEKSWDEIERKIEVIKTFSDKIHIDFIDGKFANNLTFLDPAPFSKYSSSIFFEAHLMVEEPIHYLSSLAQAGFKRFLGHIEKMESQEEFVAQAQLLGEVGLALDLQTSIEDIRVPYDDLDFVLLMCVRAGFSKQPFEQISLQKIRDLRSKTLQQIRQGLRLSSAECPHCKQDQGKLPIEVDGGINDQTIALAKNAGANIFVSTSFISDSENPEESYKAMTDLL